VFRHEGPARDPRLNARIAAYLAWVAGFVNSGGFVLLGIFTSHVTGSVGRVSADLGAGHFGAAFFGFLLVLSFFVGAFGASMVIEGSSERMPEAYGIALSLQALLLAAFVVIAGLLPATHPRLLDTQAALLFTAMGMQNSLVTRLSGAVVRTTHLTGIVTDLGIEAARWYRWHRARSGLPALFRGRVPPEKPVGERSLLLLTILVGFSFGALCGGLLTLRVSCWAMALPAIASFAAGVYAFSQRDLLSIPPPASTQTHPATSVHEDQQSENGSG
jgi:uncharacterized membrane protein YoaK (UPF0700 family)